jgi:hypothetical protein
METRSRQRQAERRLNGSQDLNTWTASANLRVKNEVLSGRDDPRCDCEVRAPSDGVSRGSCHHPETHDSEDGAQVSTLTGIHVTASREFHAEVEYWNGPKP